MVQSYLVMWFKGKPILKRWQRALLGTPVLSQHLVTPFRKFVAS